MTPLFPTAIGDEEDNLVIKSEIISFEQSIKTSIFVDTNIRCDDSSVSSNRNESPTGAGREAAGNDVPSSCRSGDYWMYAKEDPRKLP